jgi:diguanylate cyclase (GGDEF)-like protein
LKQINDICGHSAGDDIIKETSSLLKKCFPNEIVSRVGGDEYVVFISDFSYYDEVHVLNELKEQVRKKDEELKKQFNFQLSFGLSVYDSSRHANLQAVIEEADSILYEFRNKSR